MMISKIAERHLSREACIYIRQSTMGQVRFNQESTERQYHLAEKAQSLGWSPQQIRILDRDLGQSGARTTKREDFKTLVSDVAMGQVGAIFSLEASRLARSNQDWHRLLELCAIMGTLVIDEDGCYDPAEFNDGLVLGMKGTFAQAELHIIRARLHGGKLNKAHKGELRFALPVGFVSTTIRLRSTPIRKCRAPFGRCSNCSSERAAPMRWSGASRSLVFAFRAGHTAVPGMANCSGVV
jgi:DNA invertase Pin-like site-specific DNA recombinase